MKPPPLLQPLRIRKWSPLGRSFPMLRLQTKLPPPRLLLMMIRMLNLQEKPCPTESPDRFLPWPKRWLQQPTLLE